MQDSNPLLTRAIAGDHEALRAVWNEHKRWVAAILMAHMPRTPAIELDDLLQETAIAVVAKIRGLRDEQAFKPWLRAVALSIAKTCGRRTKVRKTGWLKLVSFTGSQRDNGDDVVPGALHNGSSDLAAEGRRLLELARDLPDGYREPLLLKCVQGMSYRQIGSVMGVPETTVETRIARARKMLRERAEAAGMGLASAAAAAG